MRIYSEETDNGTDLDRMYGADGDPGDSHARENVSADLEQPHRKSVPQYLLRRAPKARKSHDGRHEEEAVSRDKGKLDECEGDGIAELDEDGFACIGGEGGASVPESAEGDEADSLRVRELEGGGCGGERRDGRAKVASWGCRERS